MKTNIDMSIHHKNDITINLTGQCRQSSGPFKCGCKGLRWYSNIHQKRLRKIQNTSVSVVIVAAKIQDPN
jgi:hypothetical protein